MWVLTIAFIIMVTLVTTILCVLYTGTQTLLKENNGRQRRSVEAEANLCDTRYGVVVSNPTGGTTCKCYWPSLIGKGSISKSDCSLAQVCNNGTGKLVHTITRVPLEKLPADAIIDIHEFECDQCSGVNNSCTKPGRDPVTGLPTCVPTPLADRSGGLCSYETLSPLTLVHSPAVAGKHTDLPVLAIDGPFVDKRFAGSFKNANRHSVYVPNPCSFDAFRGRSVSIENECRLTLSASGTAYCEPLSETVSTVVFDDDYLANNGGRYSNACFKFTTDSRYVNAYIIEYFTRPTQVLEITTSTPITTLTPPLPVVSLEIEIGKINTNLIDALGLRSILQSGGINQKVLISHGEFPEDVESLPVPFDKNTMSQFLYEHNDFVYYLPTSCAAIFKCLAPVQKVKIPNCDNINEERNVVGFTLKTVEVDEYDMLRQQHVVACREPYYDKRLAIVPNIDVNPLGAAYDANPTSAVLRFDKSDLTVRPYWYRSFFNNKQEVRRYVSNLPSRPTLYKPIKGAN